MTDKLRAAAEAAIGAMVRAAITGHADALDGYAEALRAALAEPEPDSEPDAEPYKRSERASPVLVESEALRLCKHPRDFPPSFTLGWRAAEAFHGVGSHD